MTLSPLQAATLQPLLDTLTDAKRAHEDAMVKVRDACAFLLAGMNVNPGLWTGTVDLTDGVLELPLVEQIDPEDSD